MEYHLVRLFGECPSLSYKDWLVNIHDNLGSLVVIRLCECVSVRNTEDTLRVWYHKATKTKFLWKEEYDIYYICIY